MLLASVFWLLFPPIAGVYGELCWLLCDGMLNNETDWPLSFFEESVCFVNRVPVFKPPGGLVAIIVVLVLTYRDPVSCFSSECCTPLRRASSVKREMTPFLGGVSYLSIP